MGGVRCSQSNTSKLVAEICPPTADFDGKNMKKLEGCKILRQNTGDFLMQKLELAKIPMGEHGDFTQG